MVIIAACIPTLVPLFHIAIGRKSHSSFAQNQSGGSAGYNGYHPDYSVRMRERIERKRHIQGLESISSDTESQKNVLGPKTKIIVDTQEPLSSPTGTWYDDDSQNKIAVTKQWSVKR